MTDKEAYEAFKETQSDSIYETVHIQRQEQLVRGPQRRGRKKSF